MNSDHKYYHFSESTQQHPEFEAGSEVKAMASLAYEMRGQAITRKLVAFVAFVLWKCRWWKGNLFEGLSEETVLVGISLHFFMPDDIFFYLDLLGIRASASQLIMRVMSFRGFIPGQWLKEGLWVLVCRACSVQKWCLCSVIPKAMHVFQVKTASHLQTDVLVHMTHQCFLAGPLWGPPDLRSWCSLSEVGQELRNYQLSRACGSSSASPHRCAGPWSQRWAHWHLQHNVSILNNLKADDTGCEVESGCELYENSSQS